MRKAKPYNQWSPDARALDVVGDKWTLLIVRDLLPGPTRQMELRDRLPGISSAQLQTRLQWMEAHGLVTRTRYREVPPRVVYELTDRGRELVPVLAALARWGLAFVPGPARPGEADPDGKAARRLADGIREYGLDATADLIDDAMFQPHGLAGVARLEEAA